MDTGAAAEDEEAPVAVLLVESFFVGKDVEEDDDEVDDELEENASFSYGR